MNNPKMFKLGIQNDHRSDMVLGLKGQRSGLELGLGYRNTVWVQTLRVPSSFM